jgi:L-rhamnose-H+ transport protein
LILVIGVFLFLGGLVVAIPYVGEIIGGVGMILALLGGFVSNAIFCSILLIRNRTWSRYALASTGSYWFLAALMGVIWVVSLLIYGRAADMMGELGSSAGWAITMGCCILASNVWGILTGEWRQARGKPFHTMIAGLATILLAIAVSGYGR